MKATLFIATIFFSALVYGQNTSTAIQTGMGNESFVNQNGSNKSEINQEFKDNSVSVQQIGINESIIKQSGNVGGPTVSGWGNQAIVSQIDGSTALQFSEIIQAGDYNYAIAQQQGNGNISQANQTYNNHFAFIKQMGGGNNVWIYQTASTNHIGGNYSKLIQNGDQNKIESEQTSIGGAMFLVPSYSNMEVVFQTGNFNSSKLWQSGRGNNSCMLQSSTTGAIAGTMSGTSNLADVLQMGNMNSSIVSQESYVSVAVTDNQAMISQTGNLGNQSFLNQSGANMALITQSN